MTDSITIQQLPRIEDYRAELSPEEISAARFVNTRSIAMQAYLFAFPAFLHMRLRPDQADLTHAPDGSLTLYLQSEKPTGVTEGSWLPAPSGNFSVALRTYLPQKPILDRTWSPPGVKRVE